MGADIKKLRSRIKSVDSTLHLTKAMGLVASSKMRRAMREMNNAREYRQAVRACVDLLTACPECAGNPCLTEHEGGKTAVIAIAGDKGMAGGYNSNVFRQLRKYGDADIIPIGKKVCERYKSEVILAEKFSYEEAKEFAGRLYEGYITGEYREILIVGTEYKSMMTQLPVTVKLLPIEKSNGTVSADIIFEPTAEELLSSVIMEYAASVIYSYVKEGFSCETASRRTAMDSAGKNAQTMIDSLMLEYNTARQGAITQEITEIVAGSGTEDN